MVVGKVVVGRFCCGCCRGGEKGVGEELWRSEDGGEVEGGGGQGGGEGGVEVVVGEVRRGTKGKGNIMGGGLYI